MMVIVKVKVEEKEIVVNDNGSGDLLRAVVAVCARALGGVVRSLG